MIQIMLWKRLENDEMCHFVTIAKVTLKVLNIRVLFVVLYDSDLIIHTLFNVLLKMSGGGLNAEIS